MKYKQEDISEDYGLNREGETKMQIEKKQFFL